MRERDREKKLTRDSNTRSGLQGAHPTATYGVGGCLFQCTGLTGPSLQSGSRLKSWLVCSGYPSLDPLTLRSPLKLAMRAIVPCQACVPCQVCLLPAMPLAYLALYSQGQVLIQCCSTVLYFVPNVASGVSTRSLSPASRRRSSVCFLLFGPSFYLMGLACSGGRFLARVVTFNFTNVRIRVSAVSLLSYWEIRAFLSDRTC